MARNFIFQVNSKGEVDRDCYITPVDFYETDYVMAWLDYFYDEEDVKDTNAFELFVELVEGERFKSVVTVNQETQTVTLHPGFKEVWFSQKFETFKRLVTDCTMNHFVDDLFVYQVHRTLGGSFDAFIQDDADGSVQKMDAYFRQLNLIEPLTLHFGGVVGFHY